ncbi:TPA: restriction endonuclease subunit S [Yersinia enterocolitica]
MVPEGWKVVTLGEVIHESAFGPRFSAELYSDNGNVGTIRTTDLDNEGNINYKTIPYANLPDSFEAHYLKNNDLLITRSGTCGIPCLFEKQDKPIIAGAFLIRFILKDNVHPKYIHSLLKSEHLQRDIHNLSSGGVQKNLSGTNLKKLKFSLPPFLEQKKIARILCTWDKAINTTKQMLANSQKLKEGLMQQLLTGSGRFLDFSGEWKTVKLCDIAKIVKGKALSSKDLVDGEIPVIAGGKSSPYTHSHFTHENVITVSASGAYAGYVSYHPYKIWASDCSVVEAKNNSDIGYIYQLLRFLQNKIYSLQSGGAQPHIYPKDLESLQVIIPSRVVQKRISSVLAICDKEIDVQQQKLHYLKQEKKALMQQLLTGKRRVKVEAA